MMKRIFIVHGWDGYPEEGWFPWLKRKLEERGFTVHVPQLPDAGNPRISTWVPALAEAVGVADEETYFVGHSMGCQAITRYLESLPEGTQAGGAVFVAGFFKRLTGLQGDAEAEIVRHWLGTPIDLQKVRSHLRKSIAIFSDDDRFVPSDNADNFKEKLGSKIVIEHKKGHFSGPEDNCTELPAAFDAALEVAGER